MMNLKKSDKLIAIVGVVILIVAAIGIVLYTSTEKEDKDTIPEAEVFYVTWMEYTGEMPIEGYAGKVYNEPFTIADVPAGSILTGVNVQLTWEDDNTHRGILSKGIDTLTAEICLTGGEAQPDVTQGRGNNTLSFTINDRPYDETIDAEDFSEAGQIVYDMTQGKNDASFDVTITVKTGEKLRRPLQYLRDKGNRFELHISYTYYTPIISLSVSNDSGENDDDTVTNSYRDNMYQTSYGRDWI
jgi:hypothetical protein